MILPVLHGVSGQTDVCAGCEHYWFCVDSESGCVLGCKNVRRREGERKREKRERKREREREKERERERERDNSKGRGSRYSCKLSNCEK